MPSTREYLIERAKQEGWQTTQPWKRAFRALAVAHAREQGHESDALTLCEELDEEFQRIPDAWRVVAIQDPGCDKLLVLELLEVDIRSPGTGAKLEDYDALWWRFDGSAYFELRVYRMDGAGNISLVVSDDSEAGEED